MAAAFGRTAKISTVDTKLVPLNATKVKKGALSRLLVVAVLPYARTARGSYVLYLELPVRLPNAIYALAVFKPRAARIARVSGTVLCGSASATNY